MRNVDTDQNGTLKVGWTWREVAGCAEGAKKRLWIGRWRVVVGVIAVVRGKVTTNDGRSCLRRIAQWHLQWPVVAGARRPPSRSKRAAQGPAQNRTTKMWKTEPN